MNIPSTCSAAALLALALLANPQGATAQSTTATTGPLGYYTQNLPAGGSLVSIGLVAKNDFSGEMTGLTSGDPSSTIHQVGAGWTPGEFSNHYVEIREGVWEGLVLDIVSNDAENVVVEGNLGLPPGFNLGGTEKYAIRAHNTLGKVFPGGGGLQTTIGDFVTIFSSEGTSANYTLNAGSWIRFPNFTPAEDVVIYPGTGILITTSGQRSITVGGNEISTVKATKTLVPIYGNVVNLVGLINPLVAFDNTDPIYPSETTLGTMGFNQGPTPFGVISEFVQTFNPVALTPIATYTWNGANMITFPGFVPSNNATIPIGTAFSIATSTDKFYSQPSLIP